MTIANYLGQGMDYASYRELVDLLLEQGKTTGPKQTEDYLKYALLNQQRMNRLDKTAVLNETIIDAARKAKPQTWIVLTEGWCGDAAQSLPVIAKIAAASEGKITLKLLLRDENLELIDQYLTHGGRSIPKLISVDNATEKELFNWGPRPVPAQELLSRLKAENVSFELLAEQLHGWYAKDKAQSLQAELQALLEN